MGVISETLKVNEVNTQKKFFEFEKTKERRQGEAFKKEKKKKSHCERFQLSGELTAASRWLLPGHLNASSWSKSCRLSCWGFAATPLSSDTAEGRSLQTQTLLCFFFFFTASCCNLAILQGGARSLKNTISEAPGGLSAAVLHLT